jgi:hypothetical protein
MELKVTAKSRSKRVFEFIEDWASTVAAVVSGLFVVGRSGINDNTALLQAIAIVLSSVALSETLKRRSVLRRMDSSLESLVNAVREIRADVAQSGVYRPISNRAEVYEHLSTLLKETTGAVYDTTIGPDLPDSIRRLYKQERTAYRQACQAAKATRPYHEVISLTKDRCKDYSDPSTRARVKVVGQSQGVPLDIFVAGDSVVLGLPFTDDGSSHDSFIRLDQPKVARFFEQVVRELGEHGKKLDESMLQGCMNSKTG